MVHHWLRDRSTCYLGIMLGVGLLTGCSTGEYNDRMNKTMEQIKSTVDVSTIIYSDASPIADTAGKETGVTIRLPLLIGSAKSFGPKGPGSQPPFVNLPGLAYGYQMKVGGQPAYCYFASVPASSKTAEQLASELQSQIGKTFSDAVWRDLTLSSPEGSPATLRRISAVGPQKFGGQQVEGRCDLYLYSAANVHVLIGWRAPVTAANSVSFFETVEISMSTIAG